MQSKQNNLIRNLISSLMLTGLFLLPACINNNLGNRFIDAANGEWGLKVFLGGNFTGNLNVAVPAEATYGTGCSGSGLEAANCWCTSVARTDATLITIRNKKFHAWLSDNNTDAICNVQGLTGKGCEVQNFSNVPLIRFSSNVGEDFLPIIADNLQDLINANFRSSITAQGSSASWTGSSNKGIATGQNCNNWTEAGPGTANGTFGEPLDNSKWSQSADIDCSTNRALLCFEVPVD